MICALDDPKMIFYLNEACCERKIPCLLGTDVAFASILDIFDYRHERRPLRGRINSRDLAQYENKELIKRIVIPRRLPLEMLEVIPDLVSGKLSYFPQNVISASLTTAMLTDACVQLTLGNRVAKSAYVDARGLLRPWRTKILKHLFRLAKMLKITLFF